MNTEPPLAADGLGAALYIARLTQSTATPVIIFLVAERLPPFASLRERPREAPDDHGSCESGQISRNHFFRQLFCLQGWAFYFVFFLRLATIFFLQLKYIVLFFFFFFFLCVF